MSWWVGMRRMKRRARQTVTMMRILPEAQSEKV
jgi:hypothetical protein